MGEFVVEGEFIAVEVEFDSFHVPLGEELVNRPGFRVGKCDEGLFRSSQMKGASFRRIASWRLLMLP